MTRKGERRKDFPPSVRLRWKEGEESRDSLPLSPSPPFSSSMFAKKWMGSSWKGKRGEEGKKLLRFFFSLFFPVFFHTPPPPPQVRLPPSIRPGAKEKFSSSSFPSLCQLSLLFFLSTSLSLSWPISKKRKKGSQIPPQGGIISPPFPFLLFLCRWKTASQKLQNPWRRRKEGAERGLLSLSTRSEGSEGMRKEAQGKERKKERNTSFVCFARKS